MPASTIVSSSNSGRCPGSAQLVRMREAPPVDTAIIESGAAITGMGEPAVPPIAPAICNALYTLTGTRLRSLPIADQIASLTTGT